MKQVFLNRRGEIRLGWLLLAAAVLYTLAAVGVSELYWYLYRTMMGIWCITSENISRAPGAVQFLYSWSNVIVQLIQSAFLIGCSWLLARMARLENEKKPVASIRKGIAAGAGGVTLIWLVLMITGCVRQGWRLSRPDFSVNTLAILLTTFSSAFSEGCFVFGALYGMMKKRLPVWAALGGLAVIHVLMNGSMQPVMIINGLLTALVCCLLREEAGLGAAVGFRFAWGYFDRGIFGFAGAAGALYETYPVNLYWLSGGNKGILNGILTTFILAMLAYWLLYRSGMISRPILKMKSKSPS